MATASPTHHIPRPPGATDFGDWKRSPNDGGSYRHFATRSFSASNATVATGGIELVNDEGFRCVLKQLKWSDGSELKIEWAEKLGAVLISAAAYVRALEAADE